MNATDLAAVFFDFDGVILESVDVKTRAFRQLYEQRAPHIADEVEAFHLANGGMSRFDKFRHWEEDLLGEPLTDAGMDRLCAQFSALVFDGVCASPFVDGARELLADLSTRIPLFIVSATPHDEIRRIVDVVGVAPFVRSSHGSPTTKSDWLARLLAEHRLDAASCLMVGDAHADQVAAAANDVPFVGRHRDGDDAAFDAHDCVDVVVDLVALAEGLSGSR